MEMQEAYAYLEGITGEGATRAIEVKEFLKAHHGTQAGIEAQLRIANTTNSTLKDQLNNTSSASQSASDSLAEARAEIAEMKVSLTELTEANKISTANELKATQEKTRLKNEASIFGDLDKELDQSLSQIVVGGHIANGNITFDESGAWSGKIGDKEIKDKAGLNAYLRESHPNLVTKINGSNSGIPRQANPQQNGMTTDQKLKLGFGIQ